jgi:hypothetical protein
MNPHVQSFADIQGRLLQLEKQNRRLKQLGIVVLIVPALLLVMGQAPSKKTVEANEFILRDSNANVRVKLAMSDTAAGTAAGTVPEIVVFDAKGNTIARMSGGSGGKTRSEIGNK